MSSIPKNNCAVDVGPASPAKETPMLRKVSRLAGRALVDYRMIEPHDRIAVAVSGGKDSLSLLHVLRHRRKVAPFDFSLTAVHVDFGFPSFSPDALVAYLKKERFEVRVVRSSALSGEDERQIDCFWWSWNRRKELFRFCAAEGYSRIAFGHHMDDIVQTILLNQFYRAEVGAMRPKQPLFDGRITLIRPLAYVRERDMEALAKELGVFDMGQSRCADEETSHRSLIKRLIEDLERDNPQVVRNIFKSLQNIKTDYLLVPEAVS